MTSGAPSEVRAPAFLERGLAVPALPDALVEELRAGPWDHPWRVAPGIVAPVSDPAARHGAWSLERMVAEPAREALAAAGDEAAALDLACGEGRLAQELLRLGARRVLGVETRARHLRRAELLRDHFGLRGEALELVGVDDLASLEPAALGRFDVVLLVGIFDRVEDPGTLIRLAHACTRGLCVLEGAGDRVPALAEAARESGFGHVSRLAPLRDAEARYALGRRAVLLAAVESA